MFLNTLPVPKLQRKRRIARPSGGEAWREPNITAHCWPMAFWKHLNVMSGEAANHISINSSSLHSTLPQYFRQVFSQKYFELLLCLFLWRGDNEQRIFQKKKKNWSPSQNKLCNKLKRIDSQTDAAKQDYKQITFLRESILFFLWNTEWIMESSIINGIFF